MLGPAVFPQVSNITERGKKKSLRSSDPSENNPILVNEMRVSVPSRLEHSICSFLCFIYLKCEKAKAIGGSRGVRPGRGAPGFPEFRGCNPRWEHVGSTHPGSLRAAPAGPAGPANTLLSVSSNLVHRNRAEMPPIGRLGGSVG